MGALATFLSLCWLFAAHRVGGPQVFWVKMLLVVAAVIVWTSVILTLFDAVGVVEQCFQGWGDSGILWWGAAPLSLPVVTLLVIQLMSDVRDYLVRRAARLFGITMGTLSICLVLAVAIFFPLANSLNIATFPIVARIASMTILAILISAIFVNMLTIRRAVASPTDSMIDQKFTGMPPVRIDSKKESERNGFRISIEIHWRSKSKLRE